MSLFKLIENYLRISYQKNSEHDIGFVESLTGIIPDENHDYKKGISRVSNQKKILNGTCFL